MVADNMKKIGIIGFGKIGAKHFEVFKALGHTPICSANRSAPGRRNASAVGIAKTFENYHEMIKTENPDGVICSPSLFSNYAIAKEIIPYGIPILLEKPPGESIEELKALNQLSVKHKTPVMLATNRVWYSVLRNAIADAGGINQINRVEVQWSENPNRLVNERGFTHKQALNRNFTNSIHGLSLLHFLSGALQDRDVNLFKGIGKYDYRFELTGKSKQGTLASFYSSWEVQLPWRLKFQTKVAEYVFQPIENCKKIDFATKKESVIEADEFDKRFKPGFYKQAQAFLSVIDSKMVPEEVSLKQAGKLFDSAQAITRCIIEGQ